MKTFGIVAALGLTFAAACGSSDNTTTATSSSSSASSTTSSSVASSTAQSSSSGAGGSGGAGGASACAMKLATYQGILDKAQKKSGAPGAVLAIRSAECGLWEGAAGANGSAKTPMKPDNVLRIGSITKTFTAATVLALVSEGKLSLDDTLDKFEPTFPNAAAITVKELLQHTSGIFNYTDDPAWQMTVNMDPLHVWKPADLVAIAAGDMPYFAPGMGWEYSNTNFILLGMIAEQVGKKTIGVEVRSRFLDPLKLSLTSFEGEEPLKGDLAHGYQGAADVSHAYDLSIAWAAGAMASTAGDLTSWVTNLYGGAVLDPNLLNQMLTETVDTPQKGLHYGLGVMVLDPSIALDTAYGHGGDIFGYHSMAFYYPKEKIAFATIVNSDSGDPNIIAADVIPALITP